MNIWLKVFKLSLAVAIAFLAVYHRTPFLADYRGWVLGGIVTVSFSLIAWEILSRKESDRAHPSSAFAELRAKHSDYKSLVWTQRFFARMLRPYKNRRLASDRVKNAISWAILGIASLALSAALTSELQFNWMKQSVLNAPPHALEKLGQHFIIGYRSYEELKELVEKRAIGGFFITARNIPNKTKQDIAREIAALQAIRRSQGLLPLWIATDQEGEMVSRLSPPLTKLPQLSEIVKGETQIERKKDEVIKYARQQAIELSEIGVNVNFAPVVDLNKGIVNPNDKFSQIYRRAISADKNAVAKVALWYCNTLEAYGVRCTLKHFPGLGRVETDTHVASAELHASVAELTGDDWVPFREVMSQSRAFTMLGHARLLAVDTENPVSLSKQAIAGILRNDWQYDGILITDDFSMQAVYGSRGGLEMATVKALHAGVDLILISFDKDLYYRAMNAIIKADKKGSLDAAILEKSRQRLKREKGEP